jgi:hypothetical protein
VAAAAFGDRHEPVPIPRDFDLLVRIFDPDKVVAKPK